MKSSLCFFLAQTENANPPSNWDQAIGVAVLLATATISYFLMRAIIVPLISRWVAESKNKIAHQVRQRVEAERDAVAAAVIVQVKACDAVADATVKACDATAADVVVQAKARDAAANGAAHTSITGSTICRSRPGSAAPSFISASSDRWRSACWSAFSRRSWGSAAASSWCRR